MKSYSLILFCILLIISSISIRAQDIIKGTNCTDKSLSIIADSIRKTFLNNGYVIVREASISMESEYEMAVIVPLKKGSWYHVVFIGDLTSKLNEVRMYDWEENRVMFEKKKQGDQDSNILTFRFIPNSSEYYMIKPLQVNKKRKTICGHLMLLERVK